MKRMRYNKSMKANDTSARIHIESYLPRAIAIGLLAMLALLALTGCQPHPGDAPAAVNPAGIYTLASVDGQNVPCSLKHEDVTMTVQSGAFTINTNGTCASRITFSVAGHPDMNREVKATYTQRGPELTMQWEGAGMTIGQVHEDTFTMNNEGMVFVYRK